VAPEATGTFECHATLCNLLWAAPKPLDERVATVLSTIDRDAGALVRAGPGNHIYAYRLPAGPIDPVERAIASFVASRASRVAAERQR
jgi:hypothetical protein